MRIVSRLTARADGMSAVTISPASQLALVILLQTSYIAFKDASCRRRLATRTAAAKFWPVHRSRRNKPLVSASILTDLQPPMILCFRHSATRMQNAVCCSLLLRRISMAERSQHSNLNPSKSSHMEAIITIRPIRPHERNVVLRLQCNYPG